MIVYSFYLVGTNAFDEFSNHFLQNFRTTTKYVYVNIHHQLFASELDRLDLHLVWIAVRLNLCLSMKSLNSTRWIVCMSPVKKALVNWKFNSLVFLSETKSLHWRPPFPSTLIIWEILFRFLSNTDLFFIGSLSKVAT